MVGRKVPRVDLARTGNALVVQKEDLSAAEASRRWQKQRRKDGTVVMKNLGYRNS